MNDKVKIALIAAVTAAGIAWAAIHYSPYQTCARAKEARIIADVEEFGKANPLVTAEAKAAAPTTEKTAAEAKRTAEIACANAEP